jgi:gp39
MNTPNNNIELHSYETFFTSLAWIQGAIITWMYATGTNHKAALAIIAACALTTLLGASTLTYQPKNHK